MATVRTLSVALTGMRGAVVEVEANIVNATPRFVLIGLPDAALNEARDRVRSALQNAGAPLIARQVVVNLSPAALPKQGPAFDVAIALVAASAGGTIQPESLEKTAHIGELALDGRLRPTAGVLPAVWAAVQHGVTRVVVPAANRAEAELVPNIEVVGAVSLRQILIGYGADIESLDESAIAALTRDPVTEDASPELSDVIGHRDAVEALIAAAAGGHHVFFLGPPGSGKTMLARRLPGMLPELTTEEAIEVASIRSLAGVSIGADLDRTPPLQAPHHTATAASLAGGGSGIIRPGAIARAHRGVLFLDEAPEFPRAVLDVLRQPIETGHITIHRAHAIADFPAQFQLVLAANPCPCGLWGANGTHCECTPTGRRKYLHRLSGPLLDRVDIQLWVPRQTTLSGGMPAPSTSTARNVVAAARDRSAHRLTGTPWNRNADVSGGWLRNDGPALPEDAQALLEQAVRRGGLSLRGADRVWKLAWTLADLAEHTVPRAHDVRRALSLRTGLSA